MGSAQKNNRESFEHNDSGLEKLMTVNCIIITYNNNNNNNNCANKKKVTGFITYMIIFTAL